MAVNHVEQRPDPGNQFGHFAPGLGSGEFIVAAGDPEVGPRRAKQCRFGLREPGHSGADESQQAAVVAQPLPHVGTGGQGIDVHLAQHDVVGVGDAQAERGPEVRGVVQRQSECLGSGSQAVGRSPSPPDGVAGKPKQSAATLRLDHLFDGEPETVQVVDQVRSLSRVGESGGFQRVQVDHQRDRCRS